jgi:hypothetical protein
MALDGSCLIFVLRERIITIQWGNLTSLMGMKGCSQPDKGFSSGPATTRLHGADLDSDGLMSTTTLWHRCHITFVSHFSSGDRSTELIDR